MDAKLILGSGSPRRRQLLRMLGVSFEVLSADVDEDVVTTPQPGENVRRRAELKMAALRELVAEEAIIITADTTVAAGDEMLNKPADAAEATAMLKRLRTAETHRVYTGMVVQQVPDGEPMTDICSVDVHMRAYTDEEIDVYVASGNPLDKAGAYAVQHAGFNPVARLSGCYTTVMGLALCRLAPLLAALGYEIDSDIQTEMADAEQPGMCALCRRLWMNPPPIESTEES